MAGGAGSDVLGRMARGFARFREGEFLVPGSRFEGLRGGQWPHTMVIACADSRVGPNMLLRTGPGELFVVRNVANLVPPPEAGDAGVGSAVEYAVGHLGVGNIIVFGHAGCGGIRALLDGADAGGGAVGRWLGHAAPVRDGVRGRGLAAEEESGACERASIGASLANLLGYPGVGERVAGGGLVVRGWYFDLVGGELWECRPPGGEFTRLVPGVDEGGANRGGGSELG